MKIPLRRRLLSPILTKILPRRMKRLIFISSLFGKIVGSKDVPKETLAKLNKAMNLASESDNSLVLPIKIQSVVWDNTYIDFTNLSTDELDSVINSSPTWVRYDEARDDITELLTILPTLEVK